MQISTITAVKRAPIKAKPMPKGGFAKALRAEKGSTRKPAGGKQVQVDRAIAEAPGSQKKRVAPGQMEQKIQGASRSARHFQPKVLVGLSRRRMTAMRAALKVAPGPKEGFVAKKIARPTKSAGSSFVLRRTWLRPAASGSARGMQQPKGLARKVKPPATAVNKAKAVKAFASARGRMLLKEGPRFVPMTDAIRQAVPTPTKRSLKRPGQALFAARARKVDVAGLPATRAKFRFKGQNTPRAGKPKTRLGFVQASVAPLTLPKAMSPGRRVPARLGTPIAAKGATRSSSRLGKKISISEPVVSASSRALPLSLKASPGILAHPAAPTRIPPKAPLKVVPQPLPESNAATKASPLLTKGPAWRVVQASATEDGQTTTWAVRPPPRDRAAPFLLEVAKNGAAAGTIKTTVRLKGLQSAAAIGFTTIADVRQLARELAQRIGQTTVQVQVGGDQAAMQAQAGFHGLRAGSEGSFRSGAAGGHQREEMLLAASHGDGIDFRA